MSRWSRDWGYDEMRSEDANPAVWKPEDGHGFVPSAYPNCGHLCVKCGRVETLHINQRSTA